MIEGSLASSGETAKKAEPDNNCDIVKVEDKTEATDLKAEQAPEVATEEKASESTLIEAEASEEKLELETGFGEDKRFENVLENLLIRIGTEMCTAQRTAKFPRNSQAENVERTSMGNVYTEEFLSKQNKSKLPRCGR